MLGVSLSTGWKDLHGTLKVPSQIIVQPVGTLVKEFTGNWTQPTEKVRATWALGGISHVVTEVACKKVIDMTSDSWQHLKKHTRTCGQ